MLTALRGFLNEAMAVADEKGPEGEKPGVWCSLEDAFMIVKTDQNWV